MSTLADVLARETREGELYETLPDGRLRCYACGHCCPLPEGAIGVCKVRFNEGGRLLVPWGYVGGVQCDPIEKKPFFHALPGRARLQLRHARLRPPLRLLPELGDVAGAARSGGGRAAARRLARRARRATRCASGARVIVSTYNEPLITSEWAVAVFKEAQGRRARRPATCRTATARRRCSNTCGRGSISTRSISRASTIATTASSAAASQPILDTIRRLHAMDFWVEIVTLLIPGFNDSRDELDAADRVRRQRLARHPVARHRVSRRLQDDRARRTRRRRCCCEPPTIGRAARPALRLRRQPARAGRRSRGHALRARAASRSSRATATTSAITDFTADGRCPPCATAVPGPLEPAVSTARSRRGRSFPGARSRFKVLWS